MKIIHCADIHLDSGMGTNFNKEKAKERRNEILNTFRRMVDYAVVNGVDAIIIAGDLYDTRKISATAVNIFINAVKNNPGITFYYLKGNHDAESLLGAFDVIPDNLKLFGNSWTSYRYKSIDITGIELDKDNSRTACDSLALDRDNFNIVIMHGQKSEYAGSDKAETINLRALRNKGIDYLALGHVHSYCSAKLDSRGKWCYPGCLEGRGFDECGEHGFVLIDIDEDKLTYTDTFVPFASRKVCEIHVDISGCRDNADIESRIMDKKQGTDESAVVKIVLSGKVECDCIKDTELIENRLKDMFYALRIYDESSFIVDYHSYENDRSLKGEFVRMVKASELGEDEKAEVIRYGIQALSGRHEE